MSNDKAKSDAQSQEFKKSGEASCSNGSDFGSFLTKSNLIRYTILFLVILYENKGRYIEFRA